MDDSGRTTDEHEPAHTPGLRGLRDVRPRTVCLCVDDFGLHSGVNKAALRLVGLQRVHAVAGMVGGPAWRAFGPALRRIAAEGVDVGLHLDFTEHPLHAASRRDLGGFIAASLLRRLDPSALRVEIAAQLDAFEQALSQAPAFVDGHQHVHQLPLVRRALLDELGERYGALRPWLRSTQAPPGLQAKARFIHLLGGRGLAALARQRGHLQNQHLLGVYDFRGGPERYRSLLAAWLCQAGDADLLLCHPSRHAGVDDPIGPARLSEFSVLDSPAFVTLLHDGAVQLAPMSAILARRRATA